MPTPTTITSGSVAAKALQRYDLENGFRHAPREALRILHQEASRHPDRELLMALSQLSYIEAERLRLNARSWETERPGHYFLASAIYSYLSLFDGAPGKPPSPSHAGYRS